MPINFAIKLAVTVAMQASQMAMQASKRTTGPRLDELTVTVADFGTPIPRFLGERRFACPVFHAEDLKEVQHSTKVKGGGKQTTFSYLATFACAIADNEIDKVLKIFFDDKLVYDATGAGPISYASSLGIDLNSVMRIYKGTEDQLPDPRYSAWCEDRYGPDSAPAYRGVSYLFFEELPVDNFGNRIPQISVIAVSASQQTFPYIEAASPHFGTGLVAFSKDFSRFVTLDSAGSGYYAMWDNPTHTLLATGPWPAEGVGGHVFTDNNEIFVRPDATHVQVVDYDCSSASPSVLLNHAADTIYYCGGLGCLTALTGHHIAQLFDGGGVTEVDVGFKPLTYGELDGLPWALGLSGTNILLQQIGGSNIALTLSNPFGSSATPFMLPNSAGNMAILQSNHIAVIDTTGSILHSAALVGGYDRDTIINHDGSDSIWLQSHKYSLIDGSLEQSVTYTDWYTDASSQLYDPLNDALFGHHASGQGEINWLFLRFSNAGTTLGAIVSKMCDAAGLLDRDTSLLTQAVAGYSWTRGDVKSQMDPILDIHDVDARPHDFTIEFLPRGNAPVGSIVTADFAKNGDGPRYKVTSKQDTDLPRLLRINFADTGFDQQINNILSPLPAPAVDSQQDAVIDGTTYADTPDGMQQKGDRYMRRAWNSRESVENAVTAQESAREPGDVTTLYLDSVGQNARLTGQTFVAGGRIDCTWTRDEVNLAALNAATVGAQLEARDPEVITYPAPVRGFVIDAPYRGDSDADVRPLLYSGAGAYGGLAFPGAAIFEAAADGVYDELFATVGSGATWGTCGTTLGAVPSPWMWDRGNTLTVTVQEGSLTSCTEADVDADPTLNLILVGRPGNWEYLNFTTATLNMDGSYVLSGLKRGRRGTEWACAGHTGGEVFVLASSLDVDEMGLDEVGADLSFKAQAIGRSLDAAPAIDIATYTGATLKPYAPARIAWSWNGTDLTGTITRRTRIGGAWTGGSTIPLNEASEAYEVDVYNGSTFKRTIPLSATNVFTYTAAMAAADGITLPTPPSVQIFQMSDAVGRGYPLAA